MHRDHLFGDDQRLAHRHGGKLDLAGALQRPLGDEHFRQAARQHHRSMVLEHQDTPFAQVLEQAHAFVFAHRDAFEIVVGEPPGEVAGVEVDRLEPAFKAAHRHPRGGVGVADRMGPRDVAVEQPVLDEPGLVDGVRIAVELVAVEVDLDQVRGADFRIEQPERVDQERAFLTRDLDRDVVVNRFRPSEVIEDAVSGGELEAGLPFFFAAIVIARMCVELGGHGDLSGCVSSAVLATTAKCAIRPTACAGCQDRSTRPACG